MRTILSRTRRTVVAVAAGLALVGSGIYAAAASSDMSGSKSEDAPAKTESPLRQLIEAYRTTAPFHNVDNALAAGWEVQPMCMDYPDGLMGEAPGTMGHHFFNADYLTDGGRIDPSEPELVLYEKRADGTWRLNAVEYIISARDLPGTAPAPELFGRKFTWFPDVGAAGVWGLHVWLWRANPHGLFANLNPLVTCAHADAMHIPGQVHMHGH